MNGHADLPSIDIVARIAELAPALRSAERKVAALILDDLAGVSRASIGALAETAEVSVATVTRFAKAVGRLGVRELKLRLAQAAVGQRFFEREPAEGGAGPDSLANASMIYVFGMGAARPRWPTKCVFGSCGSDVRSRRIKTGCCSAWWRRLCRAVGDGAGSGNAGKLRSRARIAARQARGLAHFGHREGNGFPSTSRRRATR